MGPDDLILRVKTPPDWDHEKFTEDIACHRPVSFAKCEVGVVCNIVASFQKEFIDELTHNGLSNFLKRVVLEEAVVKPGDPKPFFSSLIVLFLQEIGVDSELIIVDPYFFAKSRDSSYPSLVESILKPFISTLTEIKIVTRPDMIDLNTKNAIELALKKTNGSIVISHTTSPDFHDRFWITSQRTKGILTGSSLGGLGKKYALIDKLDSQDVQDIVSGLQSSGLI